MKKRPTSVTVVSWILIAVGAISVVTTTITVGNPAALDLMRKSPIPIPVQYAITYIGLLITIVSGIAMLRGCNWARFLYLIWSVIGLVIGFSTSPMKAMLLPGLGFLGVVVFFLFRRNASEYFSTAKSSNDAEPI